MFYNLVFDFFPLFYSLFSLFPFLRHPVARRRRIHLYTAIWSMGSLKIGIRLPDRHPFSKAWQ